MCDPSLSLLENVLRGMPTHWGAFGFRVCRNRIVQWSDKPARITVYERSAAMELQIRLKLPVIESMPSPETGRWLFPPKQLEVWCRNLPNIPY